LAAFYFLVWVDLDFISVQAAAFLPPAIAAATALWAIRGIYALLAVFFAAFYLFSLNFPAKNALDAGRARREKIQIAVWTFFFVASFTSLIVKGAVFDPDLPLAVSVGAGPLFWVYATAAALTLSFSFLDLSRNRRFADAQNRQKALYVVLAAGVFGIFNFIFNVVGPVFGGIFRYGNFFSLFGDYAIAVMLGAIIYQILRDKLFGIKVILVEIFVGLMGASLAVMPFFMDFLWQQAMLIVLFVMFCIFGYLLIKGTIKEYQEKEILEQKVAKRTKELEAAKLNLEEANSTLEIRVQARTRELKELNRTLEQKVIARTNDLETKIKDLEAFQRITVSRELKMIELKQEIERLQKMRTKAGN
ncbi:MAG: hypothetical protein WCX69_05000, partial [Candidatus Paceibacterota bacterium]